MYRTTAGPSRDLEVFSYERREFDSLPNRFPNARIQGMQILDFQNKHATDAQASQMAGFHVDNPLPNERFVGPFRRHIHEPLPLSVNEVVYE